MKRLIMILAITMLLTTACANKDSYNNYDYSYSSSKPAKEIDYFNNLEITNTSIDTDYVGWQRVMGEIKNNNSQSIIGYMRVNYYKDNALVDSVLIGLPLNFSSGETSSFHDGATMAEFDSYKFVDDTIMGDR
jgi:hypothetical protein